MDKQQIATEIAQKLGLGGRMISGSKSGYNRAHPDNFPIFNSNICTKEGKVWWGDMDIVTDKDILCDIAKSTKTDLFVLYEMDGRFENEDKPLINKAVVTFNADGTFTVAESRRKYVSNDLLNDSKHRI